MYYLLAFCISFFTASRDFEDFVKFRKYEDIPPVCFGLHKVCKTNIKKKIELSLEHQSVLEEFLKKKIKDIPVRAQNQILYESNENLQKFNLRGSDPIQISSRQRSRAPFVVAGDPSVNEKDLMKQISLQFFLEE